MTYAETPSPPPGPIYIGSWKLLGRNHGFRSRGSRDWLLFYNDAGSALIRHRGQEYRTKTGDIILYQPGTPQDYGQHEAKGRWDHIWVHWTPRAETLDWLRWPELSPGLRHLALPKAVGKTVLRELALAHSALRTAQPRHQEVALNALERALLECDRVNPRNRIAPWHPRIQEAVEYMTAHLEAPQSLEGLARRFGFSRSRFAELFRRQVGQPPQQFLEAHRLRRARELLVYTNQTLAQIAGHCGFACPFYLSLRFRRHFGQSPRAFRQGRSWS